VLVGNVELLPFPSTIGTFDCILYADVLEHLVRPDECLRRQQSVLAPTGEIVASIPNVNHYSVVLPLLRAGEWRYVDSGILDSTHLRFFTLKTAKELFTNTGFRLDRAQPCLSIGPRMKLLHRVLGKRVERFVAYQYYLAATKGVGS